jgi:uncharacterized membrane protein
MSGKKFLLVVLIIAGYVFLSHAALASHTADSIWRQLALFMLLSSITVLSCWAIATLLAYARIGVVARRILTTLAGASIVCAGLLYWPVLLARLDWIYLIEHAVTNGAMCWFFAHTLFGERTPIITTLARAIHPDLPEKVVHYTRQVTIAWATFFAVQIMVSLLIFNLGSIKAWSFFANILNWPLVVLMFVVEYSFRRRVDPDFQHATIKQSIDAYLNNKSRI